MMIEQKILENPVEYCENKYPETVQAFKEIMDMEFQVFCSKQMDYGPSNIAMGTQLKDAADINLSLTGLVVRMNDKVNRLMNLVVKNNRQAQNEPTIDCFIDLSVYGVIAQLVQRGHWGK